MKWLIILAILLGWAAVAVAKDTTPCTGYETIGRCADKCPAPQFIRGFDKETGAAVCGYVTGCPYGDSIPLGAECDKFAPKEETLKTPVTPEVWGK